MNRRFLFFGVFLLFCVFSIQASVVNAAVPNIVINEILVSNASVNYDPDETNFSDWIELYNAGALAVDIGGFYLTDDLAAPTKYQLPNNIIINAGEYLLIWADDHNYDTHTNFKLKNSGESVGLYDGSQQLVDSLTYDPQLPDISFGRQSDGAATWFYFGEPTPGSSNNTTGFTTQTRTLSPQFSLDTGFYSGNQSVVLSDAAPTAQIYYTTDGKIPTTNSTPYTTAISINSTAVLRARSFDSASLPSPTVTHTYLIDEDENLPVVSVVTDPDNLIDNHIGMYVVGSNGVEDHCDPGVPKNWYQDWERPSSVALIELDGTVPFELDAGIEIHGGCTRELPRKSMAVRFRDKYGQDRIQYRLFDDKSADTFRSIILRNSGNDAEFTVFRDAMMQELVKGQMDIDWQGYRPAVVYINGQYWGIHNIREKLDEDYVETNYGIDTQTIDFLEYYKDVLAGTDQHYSNLYNYIKNNSLANQANYDYVTTQMEIDEFMNYQIAQIYFANTDWPGNNTKYWRPRAEDGRWRWILFDTDFGFGFAVDASHDTLSFATEEDCGCGWPNPYWSTLFLRKLFENDGFKHEFMQRFASHINLTFEATRVNNTIDTLQAGIEPEMPTHIALWNYPSSMSSWYGKINVMRDFGNQRPVLIRAIIDNYFDNPGTTDLTINLVGAGEVFVSGVNVPDGYTGPYFRNIPMQLTAVPAIGYAFVEWQETGDSNAQISLSINSATTRTAVFAQTNMPQLVINEIHYNPSPTQGIDEDYEFLEIYNAGITAVDLENYTISDGVVFTFPAGASIAPGEHIIVTINASSYSGQGYQVFQWDSGKLNNAGEQVLLSNEFGHILDELIYDDDSPWPLEPDSNGPSLSLIAPSWDNSLAASWAPSDTFGGTPGQTNSVICPTSAAIPVLGSVASDPDILLTWIDSNPENSSGYEIWQSTTAVYFQPGVGTSTLLPDVLDSPYLHLNAHSDASNHFYTLRNLDPCHQPTQPSNRVGVFKFMLHTGS